MRRSRRTGRATRPESNPWEPKQARTPPAAGPTSTGITNNNGNDGTITRFGWKAQNKSLLLFAGEAYNVEMGITNELFQTERDETQSCQFAKVPNTITDTEASAPPEVISPIEKFAFFMRFLDAPQPSPNAYGGPIS